jgi:hypothetical protein
MVKNIKYLFECGNYLEVIEKTNRVDSRSEDIILSEEEQIKTIYYRSYSLQAVGQIEQSLKLATTNYTKFRGTINSQLLLILLTIKYSRFMILPHEIST